MFRPRESEPKLPLDIPAWQRARILIPIAIAACWMSLSIPTPLQAQIYDSLDAYPPRWYLDTSDCDARVTSQEHMVDGGVDGGPCETITFTAGHGTEAILVYPIEPVRPLDELTANVSVMSAVGRTNRLSGSLSVSSRQGNTATGFGRGVRRQL